MIYSIEVGRWTGAFFPVCYADIYSSEDQHRIASFSAFSKSAAKNKATRFIRRMHKSSIGASNNMTIYSYDTSTDTLAEIPLSSKQTEKSPTL